MKVVQHISCLKLEKAGLAQLKSTLMAGYQAVI